MAPQVGFFGNTVSLYVKVGIEWNSNIFGADIYPMFQDLRRETNVRILIINQVYATIRFQTAGPE